MAKIAIQWDSDGTCLYKTSPDSYVVERPGCAPLVLDRAGAIAWAKEVWSDRWILDLEDDSPGHIKFEDIE